MISPITPCRPNVAPAVKKSVPGKPADAFTTVTDVSGQYSFTSLGNANLFRPGQWRMTLTAAGPA